MTDAPSPDPGPVRVHRATRCPQHHGRGAPAPARRRAGSRSQSAGTEPKGGQPADDPGPRRGRDRPRWARSKSVTEFLGREFDYVITVCDEAAEVCPVFPGRRVRLTGASRTRPRSTGTDEERLAVFRATLADLRGRIDGVPRYARADEPGRSPPRPAAPPPAPRPCRRPGGVDRRRRRAAAEREGRAPGRAPRVVPRRASASSPTRSSPRPRSAPGRRPRSSAPRSGSPCGSTIGWPTGFDPAAVDAILADAGEPRPAGPRRSRPGLQRARSAGSAHADGLTMRKGAFARIDVDAARRRRARDAALAGAAGPPQSRTALSASDASASARRRRSASAASAPTGMSRGAPSSSPARARSRSAAAGARR